MRVISLRMRANKPSSSSRNFFNAFNGDSSKNIFYGGIRNDERLFEEDVRNRTNRLMRDIMMILSGITLVAGIIAMTMMENENKEF